MGSIREDIDVRMLVRVSDSMRRELPSIIRNIEDADEWLLKVGAKSAILADRVPGIISQIRRKPNLADRFLVDFSSKVEELADDMGSRVVKPASREADKLAEYYTALVRSGMEEPIEEPIEEAVEAGGVDVEQRAETVMWVLSDGADKLRYCYDRSLELDEALDEVVVMLTHSVNYLQRGDDETAAQQMLRAVSPMESAANELSYLKMEVFDVLVERLHRMVRGGQASRPRAMTVSGMLASAV